ncbi:hypothetical protein ACP26L_36220 (plasmid) [Paenibacillus sp. S-38]|uniref:hypothetical protein n=1 Tax=Paenibacillus sp. S-38 TaxID=3416710 RepID=UPI003CE7BF45
MKRICWCGQDLPDEKDMLCIKCQADKAALSEIKEITWDGEPLTESDLKQAIEFFNMLAERNKQKLH